LTALVDSRDDKSEVRSPISILAKKVRAPARAALKKARNAVRYGTQKPIGRLAKSVQEWDWVLG